MKQVSRGIKGNERTSKVKSQLEEGSRDGSFHVQQENIKSEVIHWKEIKLRTKCLTYKGCPYTQHIYFFKGNIKFKPEDNVTWREYTGIRHWSKAQGPEVNLQLSCRDLPRNCMDCNSVVWLVYLSYQFFGRWPSFGQEKTYSSHFSPWYIDLPNF